MEPTQPSSGKTKTADSTNLMNKSIGGKTLKEYLHIAKKPVLILVALSFINFLQTLLTFIPFIGFFFAILGFFIGAVLLLVSLAVQAYVGYATVKKHGGDLLNAAVAGAVAGAISGFAGGVLGFISSMMRIGLDSGSGGFVGLANMGYTFLALISILLSPVVGAILASIIATLGGLVAGSRKFGDTKLFAESKPQENKKPAEPAAGEEKAAEK